MPNMSHCQFRNTLSDLQDCQEAIQEMLDGSSRDELSREEFEAAVDLIDVCANLAATVRDDYLRLDDTEALTKNRIRDALNGNA